MRIGLVIDHPERDVESLTLLANHLADRGMQVFLIPRAQLYADLLSMGVDGNGNDVRHAGSDTLDALVMSPATAAPTSDRRHDLLVECRRLGIEVFLLDPDMQAEIGTTPANLTKYLDAFRAERLSDCIAGYFVPGPRRYEAAVATGMIDPGRVYASGLPRFDFCGQYRERLLDKTSAGRILISGALPRANPRIKPIGSKEKRQYLQSAPSVSGYESGIDNPETLTQWREFLLRLVRDNPARMFVLHPDIFENQSFYHLLLGRENNVRLDPRPLDFAAINSAEFMLNLNTGLSVESVLMGKVPVSLRYLAEGAPDPAAGLPLDVSCTATNYDEVFYAVRNLAELRCSFDFDAVKAYHVDPWISHVGEASKKIAIQIENVLLARRPRRDWTQDKSIGWMERRLGTEAALRIKAKFDAAKQYDRLDVSRIGKITNNWASVTGHNHATVQRVRKKITGIPLSSVMIWRPELTGNAGLVFGAKMGELGTQISAVAGDVLIPVGETLARSEKFVRRKASNSKTLLHPKTWVNGTANLAATSWRLGHVGAKKLVRRTYAAFTDGIEWGRDLDRMTIERVKSAAQTIKSVDMPDVKLPEVKLPEVKLPEIKTPKVSVPKISRPNRCATVTTSDEALDKAVAQQQAAAKQEIKRQAAAVAKPVQKKVSPPVKPHVPVRAKARNAARRLDPRPLVATVVGTIVTGVLWPFVSMKRAALVTWAGMLYVASLPVKGVMAVVAGVKALPVVIRKALASGVYRIADWLTPKTEEQKAAAAAIKAAAQREKEKKKADVVKLPPAMGGRKGRIAALKKMDPQTKGRIQEAIDSAKETVTQIKQTPKGVSLAKSSSHKAIPAVPPVNPPVGQPVSQPVSQSVIQAAPFAKQASDDSFVVDPGTAAVVCFVATTQEQADFWGQVALSVARSGQKSVLFMGEPKLRFKADHMRLSVIDVAAASSSAWPDDNLDAFQARLDKYDMSETSLWFPGVRFGGDQAKDAGLRRRFLACSDKIEHHIGTLQKEAAGRPLMLVTALPDHWVSSLVYKLCQSRRVPCYVADPIFFGRRHSWNLNDLNGPHILPTSAKKLSGAAKDALRDAMIQAKQGKSQDDGEMWQHSSSGAFPGLKKHLNFTSPAGLTDPYVLYFLQDSKDPYLSMRAPDYKQQFVLLDYLASILPREMKLGVVVKTDELSDADRNGLRRLQGNLKQLMLFSNDTNLIHLVDKSKALVTVNSARAFWGVAMNKPTLALGPAYYNTAPLVSELDHFDKLPGAMNQALQAVVTDPEGGPNFVQSVWDQSWPGRLDDISAENIDAVSRSLSTVLELEKLAKEHQG